MKKYVIEVLLPKDNAPVKKPEKIRDGLSVFTDNKPVDNPNPEYEKNWFQGVTVVPKTSVYMNVYTSVFEDLAENAGIFNQSDANKWLQIIQLPGAYVKRYERAKIDLYNDNRTKN